jgi:hypothetical protein
MTRRTTSLLLVSLGVLIVGCHRQSAGAAPTGTESALQAGGRRVVVEVFNPSKRVGVARNAAAVLRQQPMLDVVYFDSDFDSLLAKRDRNLIYVRRGDTTGVGLVIAAIGDADIVDKGDPTRFVDLSVYPGKNFGAAVAH